MSAPLVSIIIPCFNTARYVGEAIESALRQTYSHREVIVIDDGSTDRSLEVIRSFGDAIRWETGPNRGGSAARNRGITLARGEAIQFLDADDFLHPQKLEEQIELTRQGAARIVYCNYATQWEDGCVDVQLQSPDCEGFDPVVFVLMRAGLQTSAPLHRKEHLLRINGFREELPCSQERDLHLRLACAGLRFHHFPKVLYTVRRHRLTASSKPIRVLDQHSNIAWCAYELLEESGGLTEERRAAIAGFLASDARAYLQHGLAEKARDYFEQARRIHSDGGIPQAYSRRTRWLVHALGPSLTQRCVGWKRGLATLLRLT
jgi:glycosyltransferase involved in cell wall biosynthesis